MNEKQLAEKLATKLDISQAEAKRTMEAVKATITDGIIQDGGVQIVGLGTFNVKERRARSGRNPKTGEAIWIEAKKVVKFSPWKNLREGLNA